MRRTVGRNVRFFFFILVIEVDKILIRMSIFHSEMVTLSFLRGFLLFFVDVSLLWPH